MKFAVRKIPIMLFGVAILAFTQPASAGMSYSETVSFAASIPPFSTNLSFTKFNSSLGTLTSVGITVNEAATIQSYVVNTTAIGGPAQNLSWTNVYTTAALTATGPDGASITTDAMSTPWSSSSSALITYGPSTNATGSGSTTTTDVAAYEGPGMGSFNVTASASSVTTTGSTGAEGLLAFGGTATVGGNVVITFNYIPAAVPEPASLGMVALGLGSIYAVRRLRRRKNA
jgi:hypothetical protein